VFRYAAKEKLRLPIANNVVKIIHPTFDIDATLALPRKERIQVVSDMPQLPVTTYKAEVSTCTNQLPSVGRHQYDSFISITLNSSTCAGEDVQAHTQEGLLEDL
jgi:hypothetical protein